MATEFQSCPGCESFILADTFECPQCGHIFDEARARANKAAQAADQIKNQQMYDTCRNCGESVRSGLVRCWSCNAFMRKDVEARYKEMTSSPQPIIFSDIPKEQRTELIPVRDGSSAGGGYGAGIFDAEEDGDFTLQSQAEAEFELDASAGTASPDTAGATTQQPAEQKKADSPQQQTTKKADESGPPVKKKEKTQKEPDPDDLFGLAMQDQRETKRKKREKIKESRKKRILLPCTSCGGWIRVHEEQSGRTVRCGQCKTRLVVPVMKKKEKAADGDKQVSGPKITVTWFDDIQMHVVIPTDVVLKPGSLQKTFETVDVGFHESGLHLVKLAPPAKKSLFGKAADGPPATEEQREQIRSHIGTSGEFSDIPFGELQSVAAEQIPNIRLVQPVVEAHASMFAGVPVFGEGRIGVYLPLQLEENKQAFLSLPLSQYRKIAEPLKTLFGHSVGAEENGVPAAEEVESLICAISEEKFPSVKDVVYYENDAAFELEVSGFVCVTCGAAVSEEGRARKKLGGANGKGIAKAKCPKCSNKMGDQKAWKIVKSPDDEEEKKEEEEDVSDVLKPRTPPPSEKAAADSATANSGSPTLDTIQGKWKMISLGQNGDYSNPSDMTAHNIIFAIEGDQYTVTAGEEVQEKGTLTVDADQDPPYLDQTVSDGEDSGKTHLGIFRVVDGKLENCQGGFDQPRPGTFESEAGSTASLAVFERV